MGWTESPLSKLTNVPLPQGSSPVHQSNVGFGAGLLTSPIWRTLGLHSKYAWTQAVQNEALKTESTTLLQLRMHPSTSIFYWS